MAKMSFSRVMYPKIALIKAAYNFTDVAFVHLDADDSYWYVSLEPKHDACEVSEKEFTNEMLAQCVRHEVYLQTKNVRELLLARAMATSVIADEEMMDDSELPVIQVSESDVLSDWFSQNESL